MKKIIQWVASSFFRQAGRFLFYIIIGGLIYVLIQHNDIDFKWTNLFGIEQVKAVTITQEVQKMESTIVTQVDGGGWTDTWGKYRANFGPLEDIRYINIVFNQDNGIIANRDYVEIPIVLSPPTSYEPSKIVGCADYGQYTNNNGQVHYLCDTWQYDQSYPFDSNFEELNFFITMAFTDGTTTGCTIQNGVIVCPLGKKKPRELRFYFSYRNSNPNQVYVYIERSWTYYNSANTSEAIQQQTNTTLEYFSDTNTTSDVNSANSFFTDTNSTSESALQDIVSTPLTLLNGLVNGTYNNLCATLNNKQICLPSGAIIWQRQHGGAGVHDHWFRGGSTDTFIAFFNLVVGGFILYKCLISLFNSVHKMLDPTKTYVEVMKL